MLLVNTETVSGKELETLGLVSGGTVQCKNFGKDFMAGLKNLVGGEMKDYTEMMMEARKIATERMVSEASALGADAVVAIHYTSSEVAAGAAEVLAYGTAVKFRK